MPSEALKKMLKDELLRSADLSRSLPSSLDSIADDELMFKDTSKKLLEKDLKKRVLYLLLFKEEASAMSEYL